MQPSRKLGLSTRMRRAESAIAQLASEKDRLAYDIGSVIGNLLIQLGLEFQVKEDGTVGFRSIAKGEMPEKAGGTSDELGVPQVL